MKAVRLRLSGIVQGVAFRPFVFRVARLAGVTGYVKNVGGSGVEIHVEGEPGRVEEFIKLLWELKPEKARIDEYSITQTTPKGYPDFKIEQSDPSAHFRSIIPPDFSICRDCLYEILSETRWHLYPFNSCAFCGPRYSMIYSVPYDRENTSMRDFPLCQSCLREYSNPEDERRFHAQGISCPVCGPSVRLLSSGGEVLADGVRAIEEAARLIDSRHIVAVKGLGGYHIAALATDDDVLAELRSRKRRPTKPFAVMCLDIYTVSRLVELRPEAVRILDSPEKPILLLPMLDDAPISRLVAPNLRKLGVFLPYTGLHYLLLSWIRDKYAIMTSGNPHNEPMCTSDEDSFDRLRGIVDYFLTHNRVIVNRVDDSVARFTADRLTLLRRGRGYAPRWIQLPFHTSRKVVAFGAMLQSAGAVAFDDKIVLTQFIGDVDEYGSFLDLEKYLGLLIKTYQIPLGSSVMVADLHPLYPSTLLAEEWSRKYGAELLKIQHHWAHIAAVMAEHGICEEEVVGIAVDGVGLGSDGSAWGGEVLLASLNGFKRVGCLKPQKMPGGDLAVEYPARMLAGILSDKLSREEISEVFREMKIVERGFRRGWEEFHILLNQLEGDLPLTSSTGRVLDASSVMLGFCSRRTYEGEPAIVLEDNSKPTTERLKVHVKDRGIYTVDTAEILLQALDLLRGGADRREIGYMVQHAVGYGLGLVASHFIEGRRFVALSGGAAVNEYIYQGLREALGDKGLDILLPREVPAGDGGIALGQAAIAALKSSRLRR
ncbi:Carbamoyltransferase HypF [Candidatus Calditenuaceae archaeon HR02]|nr:Carbamoyltransferase HypF [Candidatus Calditenuaceae archaeon HR02]